MLSTFLPFYLLPPVTKFRGVFGGRKLFLPGHFGLIFDGRVETAITSRTPRPSATRNWRDKFSIELHNRILTQGDGVMCTRRSLLGRRLLAFRLLVVLAQSGLGPAVECDCVVCEGSLWGGFWEEVLAVLVVLLGLAAGPPLSAVLLRGGLGVVRGRRRAHEAHGPRRWDGDAPGPRAR